MTHSVLLFMSGSDIAMILAVALLLFGGKKLPELARGLGSGIKEFKDATAGVTSPNNDNMPKAPVNTLEPLTPTTATTAAETHG